MLAEMLMTATNMIGFSWAASPVSTELEIVGGKGLVLYGERLVLWEDGQKGLGTTALSASWSGGFATGRGATGALNACKSCTSTEESGLQHAWNSSAPLLNMTLSCYRR